MNPIVRNRTAIRIATMAFIAAAVLQTSPSTAAIIFQPSSLINTSVGSLGGFGYLGDNAADAASAPITSPNGTFSAIANACTTQANMCVRGEGVTTNSQSTPFNAHIIASQSMIARAPFPVGDVNAGGNVNTSLRFSLTGAPTVADFSYIATISPNHPFMTMGAYVSVELFDITNNVLIFSENTSYSGTALSVGPNVASRLLGPGLYIFNLATGINAPNYTIEPSGNDGIIGSLAFDLVLTQDAPPPPPVGAPAPGAMALVGLGLFGVGFTRRKLI